LWPDAAEVAELMGPAPAQSHPQIQGQAKALEALVAEARRQSISCQ
jgi:hypothetical protein